MPPNVDPYCFLNMPEAVAAEVLTAEPPCDYDNVVPQSFPFDHAKNDQAGSGLAVIILDHQFAADQAPRVMRGFGKLLGALQLGQKGPGLVAGAAWSARGSMFRESAGNDVVENDHRVLWDRVAIKTLSEISAVPRIRSTRA
jgi:hypothetical protein